MLGWGCERENIRVAVVPKAVHDAVDAIFTGLQH